jgi:ribitol 2-dehydrogenase
MQHSLAGKLIIVTRASSGIGAATARALARLDCKVILAARSADKLQVLAEELGSAAVDVPTDMASGADITRMVETTVERFGRVDVLFANAGVYVPGDFAQGDVETWANIVDVNVTGVIRCLHAVLPHMIAQGSGDIVITSSIAGVTDLRNEPVYGASKHALETFVHTLRRQVAEAGVRVGSIAPRTVANELWGFTEASEIDKQVKQRAAIRSEDVTEAVIFMLSQPPHVTIRDMVILPQNQDI